jgi:hypothetical protein
MGFWTGIIIGALGGASIGVIITGLLVASRREEDSDIIKVDPYILDEAGTDDVSTTISSRSSVIHT